MTVAAVITAAGLGARLGSGLPKALVSVAGRPLAAWALANIADVADVVVITAPVDYVEAMEDAVASVCLAHPTLDVSVIPGGETRPQSVRAGLDALWAFNGSPPSIVLIHDAARAFMPAESMRAAIDAVQAGSDGAVPVVHLVDTLVASPGEDGAMGVNVDRDTLRAVQTPQVFKAAVIKDAHDRGAADGRSDTDDATLAREYGYRVVATKGHPWGFKVTQAGDLALAEHIARLT